MKALGGVAVIVIEVESGGKAKEGQSLIVLAYLLGDDGMDGRRQRRLVDAARLIVFIVGFFDLFGEIARIEEQEHQDIRLLDHVVPEDAVISPMAIEREIADWDLVDVDMGQIIEALMLFVKLGLGVIKDAHLLDGFFHLVDKFLIITATL